METRRGVDVQIRVFLTTALLVGEWRDSRPGRFTPGERVPSTHWVGVWAASRTGLDHMENRKFLILPGLESRPLSPSP
jgi:hypothetical protein